jgi:predicted MPP superfamily phosphohydrolase
MRISRRSFLSTVGVTAGAACVLDRGLIADSPSPLTIYPRLEARLRAKADNHPKALSNSGLDLVASDGAFATALDEADVAEVHTRNLKIPPDGLLTFAIDVPSTTWVAGELTIDPADDLRPGLRVTTLCDATVIGTPMVRAAEWSVKEITDAAPRLEGTRPAAMVSIGPWTMRAGRHYVTIAGPHFRDGGTFGRLRLQLLNRPVEDPLYSFAFITDTHVRLAGREDWMNRKMGDATAAELARTLDDLARERLAFVIHGGDMTDTATRAELEVVRDVLASQPLPVYGCIGNHDRYLATSRDDARELLASHFPGAQLDYTFTKGPVRFVVLDVEIEEPKVRSRKLQWLEETLHADAETPTVFVWHYPAFNRGTQSTSGFRLQDWSQLGRDVLLKSLMAAPNVFACINGHDHWDEVNTRNGLTFVQNAAFVEWPNSYRVYHVYRDRLEWEVRQVRNRGFIRESFLPDKAMSWMIATGEADLSGFVPFVRRHL